MEGLRQQAKLEFPGKLKFNTAPSCHSIAEITVHDGYNITVEQNSLSSKTLLDRLCHPVSDLEVNQAVKSHIQIVKIDQDQKGVLSVAKDIFSDIFHACKLDPYALHMFARGTYGFVELETKLPGMSTYYLRNNSYILIWSHNISQNSTKAIFIPGAPDIMSSTADIFPRFLQTLTHQKQYAPYPWFLRLIALIDFSRWADVISEGARGVFRNAESQTGYGCWDYWERHGGVSPRASRSSKTIGDLRDISQAIGFWAAAVAGIERNIPTALNLGEIDALMTHPVEKHIQVGRDSVNYEQDMSQMATAVKLILKRTNMLKVEVNYLQERARRLLSIVFSLNAQDDTATSLQIAASTKEDSASMKVVAIMTLVFLPGTFFATVFAIPTLHWTEDIVITSQFKIYLALTVPCTVVLVGAFFGSRLLYPSQTRSEKVLPILQ